MKNRNTIKKITVSALCVAFALSAASCGEGLLTTNSQKDMEQVIGNVSIANHEEFKEGGQYADYASAIQSMNTKILKRDLVAYFLNSGYTYVNSYGYSYKETFELLMQNLVSRKIMVQYAMAYYFDSAAEEGEYQYTVEAYNAYLKSESEKLSEDVKPHYEAHPEILTMQYFLTEGGTNTTDYDRAMYTLKSMFNNTLDSAEENFIDKDDEDSDSSSDSRTTPTGVGNETDDYYDVNYEIYTGFNTPDSCGSYERKDGSTQTTRKRAYNTFLSNLSANNLLIKGEDTTDFTKIDYYYVEMASQLEQALITKYSDDLNDEANKELTQSYVEGKYKALFDAQKNSYSEDQSAFETAIGSVSDTSFVLYSPKAGFGFVYNILLPFSTTQTQILSTYTNDTGLTKSEFYHKRSELLNNVRGKDLRAPWFSTDEEKNYAFEATSEDKYYINDDTGNNEKNYLFFEDNLKNSEGDNARYESLGQYYGQYPYNGTVTKDEDEKYVCTPNEVSITDFLKELEAYLNYANPSFDAKGETKKGYVTDGTYTLSKNGKFDYSEFLYYEGKVTLQDTAHKDYFVKGTDSYTAVSVINELMFAYSSDTGNLNEYMGYTVSPYKTSYVSEFEYAAQYAIRKGAGTYVVCPSDYGWHVIYVSFVYDEGEVYEEGFKWDEREKEGTFSYLFYESLKSDSSSSSSYASMTQNQILGKYNTDTCVTLYENRYKDLLSIES